MLRVEGDTIEELDGELRFSIFQMIREVVWAPAIAISITLLMALALLKPTLGAFRHRRKLGDTNSDAGLYAAFCTLGKVPEALGILGFTTRLLMGRQAKLIEYKTLS